MRKYKEDEEKVGEGGGLEITAAGACISSRADKAWRSHTLLGYAGYARVSCSSEKRDFVRSEKNVSLACRRFRRFETWSYRSIAPDQSKRRC